MILFAISAFASTSRSKFTKQAHINIQMRICHPIDAKPKAYAENTTATPLNQYQNFFAHTLFLSQTLPWEIFRLFPGRKRNMRHPLSIA